MEMLKIEQVIVGSEVRSTSAEIKYEPEVVPLESSQHQSLQCFQCLITFCNLKAKERHMRKSHGEQYKQQLQQRNTLFTCYKCDKCFTSSKALSKHHASHGREEMPFCCGYCRKNFFTFTELEEHRRQECMERRFPCSDCGALFLGPWRLRNHRVAVHPKCEAVVDVINTYQCCKCSQGFQTEEELLKHQEKFANALNCEVKPQGKKRGQQPKSAAQFGVVDKKIKQEEGADECQGYSDYTTETFPSSEPQTELKIPCPEADCNLLFSSVAVLRAHKKECHGPLPCKTYTCTECNESCTRPKQLKANKVTNHCSGFACLTCGKSFAQEHPKDI